LLCDAVILAAQTVVQHSRRFSVILWRVRPVLAEPDILKHFQGLPDMLSKIRSISRGFFFPSWSIPIALLALTLLTYGLRALSLGFFWDDWPYLWYFHRLGPAGIVAAFSEDRPFLSVIYNTTLTIFGSSIAVWQIFALTARWLCSFGLWAVLAQTWPRESHRTAWVAILFAIYPGFTQQWISVIYGQAFFLMAALFFSIALTLWLARQRRSLARLKLAAGSLLALSLSAITMFSTEYFFGLELMRPLLLWLVFSNETSPGGASETASRRAAALGSRLASTARWWSIYLVLMLAFILWRGLVHTFPSASLTTLEEISRSPLQAVQGLALTIMEDLVEASLVAWGQTLQLAGIIETAGAFAGLRSLAIIAGAGLLAFIYLTWLRQKLPAAGPAYPTRNRWDWQAVITGLILLLVAGWPFWVTGLPLRMSFPQDRYTLPLAPGVSLLLAGLIDLLAGRANFNAELVRKAVLVSIMVGLSAGFHNNLALQYRQDWQMARNFFWQLTWRAPDVQHNTLFLSESLPFQYFEDDSLTAPLNWTYDPTGDSTEMSYMLYDLHVRQYSLSLQPGRPVNKNFRATQFKGSTSQVLVLYYAPPGCVRILDPIYDADFYQLPDRIQRALPLSAPSQWILDANSPAALPPDIFSTEPEYHWCYYYQKAELARQNQDWDTIYRLGNDSIKSGIRPGDPAEYLPFIEGYIHAGLQDDAYQITEYAYQESRALQPALCAVWRRAMQSGIELRDSYHSTLQNSYHCILP